ncbi:unnamed protein product [Hyaloperonospora brassicae]|uniref:Peptidase M28 domain-containing protein n=1 Tax=Hyaloperonospora brassicae TaxID=162125 RepID=A0AAV0TTG9_HYABA|nr:unnamed protein product [Hyaloperonospora brassicae]
MAFERPRQTLLRIRSVVASHCLSLCWGSYVLGLFWLLLHPAVTITTGELKCRNTYMSENALLVDLMDARSDHTEARAAHDMQQKLLRLPDVPSRGCGDNCSAVVNWIDAELRGLDRVEVYRQEFQLDATSAPRTNVYGVLRASPLADGKEAIVLVTHYCNVGAGIGDSSGLSVGLALLNYLAKAKWLAKDVILLAADDGALDGSDGFAFGTEAWLQAYHLDSVQSDLQEGLPMRAGIIRAAINLETMPSSHPVGAVGIYAAGMNGQLPNLDLVNTAVRAFRRHRIPTVLDRASVQQVEGHVHESYVSSVLSWMKYVCKEYAGVGLEQGLLAYLDNLKGMLHFMTTLASGSSGPHANFISYNIDSVTLSLTTSPNAGDRPLSTRGVLRSIEMVVRAVSNIEEKLHQSFYLYVLPSPSTFVSVGEYFYALALAISPAIAHLLYVATKTSGMRVAFALAVLLVVETLCVLLLIMVGKYYATPAASLQAPRLDDKGAIRWWALTIAISFIQAFVVAVIVPALRSVRSLSGCVETHAWGKQVARYEVEQQMKLSEEPATTSAREAGDYGSNLDPGWRAIKFMTMAVLVYAHCILGILNYPMAIFGALPMAHFASIVPLTTASQATRVWNGLWLAISSPLVLLVLLSWTRMDAIAGLSYIVDSFAHHTNLLALPYICCIYASIHTLSLAIWLYPAPQVALVSEGKSKKE